MTRDAISGSCLDVVFGGLNILLIDGGVAIGDDE